MENPPERFPTLIFAQINSCVDPEDERQLYFRQRLQAEARFMFANGEQNGDLQKCRWH